MSTTIAESNRYVAERLGVKPVYDLKHLCPNCGTHCLNNSVFCNPPIPIYPDFSDRDRIMLLELMRKRDDWNEFAYKLSGEGEAKGKLVAELIVSNIVDFYILTKGSLCRAVEEWFKNTPSTEG